MWRPISWANPYNDNPKLKPMAIPIGSLPNAYEAGASAMLSALFKMAGESSTGEFVIDSKIQAIFEA